jgi:hypothetical protein
MHGKDESTSENLVRKYAVKRPPGGIGTDGRIILSWILMKQDVKIWPGFKDSLDIGQSPLADL